MPAEAKKEYLHLFQTQADHDSAYNGNQYVAPWVAYTVATEQVSFNKIIWDTKYLTFEALESGTITIDVSPVATVTEGVEFSRNGGSTWETLANNTVTLASGDKVAVKAEITPQYTSVNMHSLVRVSSSGRFNAMGNPLSLIHGDDFRENLDATVSNYTFYRMFSNSTGLVSAENLKLTATTLTNYCYNSMFQGCTALTTAPTLPATTLTTGCYGSMFNGCTSLTTAPALAATTLANSCYNSMFRGCTALTTAPVLPARTLSSSSTYGCYSYMFNGCSSLTYIKMMGTTLGTGTQGTPPNQTTRYDCTYAWVTGVAASGTYVKNSSASYTTRGDNGIPSGWTVETASE